MHRFEDLVSEPLLYLQSVRENIDDTRDLRESTNEAVGQIGDVYFTVEGEHVVLAETVELDVAHQDHLSLLLGEFCTVENGNRIHVLSGREGRHGFGYTSGRFEQSFSLRIFSEQSEYFVIVVSELVKAFLFSHCSEVMRVQSEARNTYFGRVVC